MGENVSFGLLLPHFGADQSFGTVREAATRAERVGFDSAWVRDHLYIPPEHREHGGITEEGFLESFQTLAATAAVTDDLTLGTAVANAHRHPLKLSQHVGTLDHVADGRVVCGVGAGTFRGEFEAMGLPFERQGRMADETLEILRRTFRETGASYDGEVFSFEDVTIDPRPGDAVPIWYGGLAPVAVKRAFRHADGWFPGRMPFEKLDERVALLEDLEREYDRTLDRGYVVIYSVDEDAERARARLDLEGLVEDANALLREDYETPAEIEGSFVAGDPGDCVAELRRIADRGFEHVVLDMRHGFDELGRMLSLTGDRVLPAFG